MAPPPQKYTRPMWLPGMHAGHLVLPERHYRVMKAIRRRLHRRSATRLDPGTVNKQRHRSLVLLLFGVIRIIAWTILGAVVGAGLLGVSEFAWAKVLAESVPFVAMISIYANWATDLDAATAAFAALVASDSHAAVVATGVAITADLGELEGDIARLADLQPGDEATALSTSIRARLAAAP